MATSGRQRDEWGVAEFAVCFAAFCALALLGVQCALWQHAAHLARDAADRGDEVARAYGSEPDAGSRAAAQFVGGAGPHVIEHLEVTTTELPGGIARVTVSGKAEAIIPGISLRVSATATGPIDELR